MKRISVITLGTILAAASLLFAEEPWNRFRGPNGSGIAEAPGVPAHWTQTDYNWTVKLPGFGHSSPVVVGKRLFVTCGERETAQRMILCLDTATGKTLWQRDYPSQKFTQNNDNSYATSTPAADAHGVVVTWSTPEQVTLLSLDNDGKEMWKLELGPFVGIHGSGNSPILTEDLAVLYNDQEDPKSLPPAVYARPGAPKSAGTSFVIAVDRKSGKLRWQLPRTSSQQSYSTPCLYTPEGGKVQIILPSTAHGLTAVEAETGKVAWEAADLFKERCIASPIVAEGLILACDGRGSSGNSFSAVRPPTAQQPKPSVVYTLPKALIPLVPTPLAKDGRLYLLTDNGTISCLKLMTGDVIWRQKLEGSFYSSPICVNNRIYCVNKAGEVQVLATGDKYELLGKVPLGEKCFATPAVADGVMYLRTTTQLVSLGGKKQ